MTHHFLQSRIPKKFFSYSILTAIVLFSYVYDTPVTFSADYLQNPAKNQQYEEATNKRLVSGRDFQLQKTEMTNLRKGSRIGISLECEASSISDECADEYSLKLKSESKRRYNLKRVQIDLSGKSELYFQDGSLGDHRLSDTTISLITPLGDGQTQIIGNVLNRDFDNQNSDIDGLYKDSNNWKYSAGIAYKTNIMGVDTTTRLSKGTNAAAEDITSPSLSGLARIEEGNYDETIGGITLSRKIGGYNKPYIDYSYNRRSDDTDQFFGKTNSSGHTLSVGNHFAISENSNLQAEIGYRYQDPEVSASQDGLLAGFKFDQRLDHNLNAFVFGATDLDESQYHTVSGARVYKFGGGFAYDISKQTQLDGNLSHASIVDQETENYNQINKLDLSIRHNLYKDLFGKVEAQYLQAIVDANQDTEIINDRFSLGFGLEYQF